MADYIALMHKELDTDFGISFPDFPGCVSAASALTEVKAMAEEALKLHLSGMREDQEKIPAPSRFEDFMQDQDNRDAFAFLVHIDCSCR